MIGRLFALCGFLLLSGCLYNARQPADQALCDLAARPYDLLPASAENKASTSTSSARPTGSAPAGPVPVVQDVDVQTTAYMQAASGQKAQGEKPPKIPPEIPGSEAPLLPGKQKITDPIIKQIYPELPQLPAEPVAQPGPDGKPYTLSALQRLAALNSPQLRQAALAVETARGNWIQARAYPNPTVGWNVQPSNDGSTAGVQGPFIAQTIKFAGKLKLASAAAELDLRNAELAFKRARSDLATAVRNAYFAVLVARETTRVNRALAGFTDQIYRNHVGWLGAGTGAAYEPAALRAQAYQARLAYKQSIQTYIYAWKQLVAAVGIHQLPLTEVVGRIDAFVPYFDYDAVLAHALQQHTDVLIARNGLEKARFNLKLAQITPYPDVDFNISVLKEFSLPPKQFVHTATIGMPLPVWDQNKGAIYAAESALASTSEEPHRVEVALTNTLATAYMGYKNNLEALEYYRRFILPDQVRAYRGVFDRRQIEPANAQFGDLVAAQQALATGVSSYLGILGTLWASVASVADVLQTDDLFQIAQARELPPLPDLDQLPEWPCCHECPAPCGAVSSDSCPAARPQVERRE